MMLGEQAAADGFGADEWSGYHPAIVGDERSPALRVERDLWMNGGLCAGWVGAPGGTAPRTIALICEQ